MTGSAVERPGQAVRLFDRAVATGCLIAAGLPASAVGGIGSLFYGHGRAWPAAGLGLLAGVIGIAAGLAVIQVWRPRPIMGWSRGLFLQQGVSLLGVILAILVLYSAFRAEPIVLALASVSVFVGVQIVLASALGLRVRQTGGSGGLQPGPGVSASKDLPDSRPVERAAAPQAGSDKRGESD